MSTTLAGEARPATPWKNALAAAALINAALCVGLVALIGEVIPPLLVFTVVFGVLGALLLGKAKRWLVVVAMVAGVLFIGGNLPFIIEDLAHPDTPAGFVPIWLMVVTTVFLLVAGVMALRAAASAPRVAGIAAVVVALAGVVVSLVSASGVSDDERQPDDVLVAAEDTEYPEELTVASGGALFVENHDLFRHTFVVDDHDIKAQVPGSSSKRVEIDLEPGTYDFRCDVPGHERMEGELTVE